MSHQTVVVRVGELTMRYVLPIIVMCMSVLMIVCTREGSIKWGTTIFGCCVLYLFVLSKLGPKEKQS
jgi:membrane associated rhomboid family serine protease